MTEPRTREPYSGGTKAHVANGHVVILERQTALMHLTIRSSWGDVRITFAFIVMQGHSDVVILGDKMLKETLGIDVIKKLREIIEGGRPDSER